MARHTWPISKIDLCREPWCIVIFIAELILPIIIRGSETAKVDYPERVGQETVTSIVMTSAPRMAAEQPPSRHNCVLQKRTIIYTSSLLHFEEFRLVLIIIDTSPIVDVLSRVTSLSKWCNYQSRKLLSLENTHFGAFELRFFSTLFDCTHFSLSWAQCVLRWCHSSLLFASSVQALDWGHCRRKVIFVYFVSMKWRGAITKVHIWSRRMFPDQWTDYIAPDQRDEASTSVYRRGWTLSGNFEKVDSLYLKLRQDQR